MKKIKKKKTFIGAIINGVGAIAGMVGKGIKAKKDAELQEQQYRNQQGEIYKQETMQLANVLTQEANSQDYVEQMKNRISFKMGGTKKIKKKANIGAEWKAMSSLDKAGDIAGGVGGAIGGIGDLIGGLMYKPKDYTLKHNEAVQAQAPKVIKPANNIAQQTQNIMQQANTLQQGVLMNQNINQNPILNQAKFGTKRIVKKNLNRFK